MMDYLKYFNDKKYDRENFNCWDFVRDVFEQEEKITLPKLPIMTNESSFTYLKSNIKYKVVEKAHKGCITLFKIGSIIHAGYCIDNNNFIHKNTKGCSIARINKKSIIYEVYPND